MIRFTTSIFLLLFFMVQTIEAQNTVGLISYNINKAYDGYNLMFPHNQPNVYLLDNCGEIAHVWEDDANFRPGNMAYLTEDGLLYKSKRAADISNDPIWAGGGGAMLEIRDWDNNLIWSFEMNDSINRLHHDFAVKPNGNIIALAWEYKNTDECIAAGRDTSTLAQKVLWPDWVFEIDPNTDEIVWEWHAWDHLIQDFDDTKANFGVVADHPELIDVNYGREDGHPDWMHGNSLDYSEFHQQVMLSIPYFDEIWMIDQSTTTAEAAGSFGGNSNFGGDLMYRYGNARTYGGGDTTDQRLFFQHDAHWVDDFLDGTHPHFGKVAVFNNQVGADFSAANVIRTPWDMYTWSYMSGPNADLPADFDLTITHPDPQKMYSTGLSSVQFLPNGNSLLTAGRFGYSYELTPDNEIVWEYITPRIGPAPATQGDTLTINNNLTFRMKRYPADFAAFDGKDLDSKGWIELMPNEEYCDDLTPVADIMIEEEFDIYPNPADQTVTIEWDGMQYADIVVYNLLGYEQTRFMVSGGRKYLDISDWNEGIYFLSIYSGTDVYTRKFVVKH